jgi:hypothetical protein
MHSDWRADRENRHGYGCEDRTRTGAGRFSVDYVLFGNSGVYGFLSGWWGALIAVALGLAGGIGQLVIYFRPPVTS